MATSRKGTESEDSIPNLQASVQRRALVVGLLVLRAGLPEFLELRGRDRAVRRPEEADEVLEGVVVLLHDKSFH